MEPPAVEERNIDVLGAVELGDIVDEEGSAETEELPDTRVVVEAENVGGADVMLELVELSRLEGMPIDEEKNEDEMLDTDCEAEAEAVGVGVTLADGPVEDPTPMELEMKMNEELCWLADSVGVGRGELP